MKIKKEELQAELTRLNALRKQVKEKLKALPVLEVGEEEWKDVFGYEGLYQVSNLGNVKSLFRYAKHSSGTGFTTIKEKILSKSISQQGYYKVRLSKDGVKTTKLVHHLVAESFLNHLERSNFISIDHIDENKLNNCVDNLQIISKKDNTKKSYENSSINRQLSVGCWYKYNNSLFVYNIDNSYGFKNGEWLDNFKWYRYFGVTEAAPQEVEKALIEEAKRRYKVGDKLSKVRDDHADDNRFFELDSFSIENNCLYFNSKKSPFYSYCIFQDGQWATIIEQPVDKFAELKEAHRRGAKIQAKFTPNGRWFETLNPEWNVRDEYRIKPEEKPKVGDWIKYETGGGTKIAKLTEKNLSSFVKPKFKYTIIKDCYMIDKLNNL